MDALSTIQWRRSQVEAALWRFSATAHNWGHNWDDLPDTAPRVFRARIKKLLNMDRIPGLVPWFEDTEGLWAFFDGPKVGASTTEDLFSTHHAFLLGIGLDLINEGIKQPEVVFFLRHTKALFLEALRQIHERPGARAPVSGADRQRRLFEDDGSTEPIWFGGRQYADSDPTAWLVVRRRENKEAYPLFVEATQGKKIPFFVEPEIHFGLEPVKKAIFTHLPAFRHMILIEIADLALTLPRYLSEAVAVRRGRPPKSAKAAEPKVTPSLLQRRDDIDE